MANDRSLGLSELARFGFVDLAGTIGKLDELVKLVGDSGRSALAALGTVADPDQALVALLNLATAQPAKIKSLLKKEDSAKRLCALLGASTSLTDFLMRHPGQLEVFEKASTLAEPAEYLANIQAAVKPMLVSGFESPSAWNALRVAYRRELLKIAIFDLTQPDVVLGQPQVAAALADIAGAAIEAGLSVARAELKLSTEHGVFTADEVDQTLLCNRNGKMWCSRA